MFNPNIPLGGDYAPGQLRSTPSYIFDTADVFFFGGNKEKVAVESFQRPDAIQEREFDKLLKIDHKNIVKLLAIENDQISKRKILILELCDRSVHDMLGEPEYMYGFPDKEFLQVLGDTTSGMEYLLRKGIVNRFIKPGNIMRSPGPDGSAVYKLADFGAVRQLQAEDNFTSLYDTEEYLHPSMFGRALLQKPLPRPSNANVDLWSLGVTVYHIATGSLPFRPYGGRKNRTAMHKMTAQKASGVISAVQRESEDGPIEYGTELPEHTRMSFGLKLPIRDMLAGLLESREDMMWSYETLFETVQSILRMRVFDILSKASGQLLQVYIDPNASFAEFQENIALQTGIPSDIQVHIYDSAHFHPDASVTCASYPQTSPDEPIYLIPRGFKGYGMPVPPSAPSSSSNGCGEQSQCQPTDETACTHKIHVPDGTTVPPTPPTVPPTPPTVPPTPPTVPPTPPTVPPTPPASNMDASTSESSQPVIDTFPSELRAKIDRCCTSPRSFDVDSPRKVKRFETPSMSLLDFPVPISARYQMNHEPRGLVIIINNEKFDSSSPYKLQDRRGSSRDASKLAQLFESLKFNVLCKNDLTAQQMHDVLDVIRQEDHQAFDSFVCCILTHGRRDEVFGSDGVPIRIQDLTGLFDGLKCKSLVGKPKLFFIQACQGQDFQPGVQYEIDDPQGEARQILPTIPIKNDYLVGYSTVPDYVAYRHPTEGSLYVQTLANCIHQQHEDVDMVNILSNVNGYMSNFSTKSGYKQSSECRNTLTKALFL